MEVVGTTRRAIKMVVHPTKTQRVILTVTAKRVKTKTRLKPKKKNNLSRRRRTSKKSINRRSVSLQGKL
jgi:hypothetical protein